MPSISRQLIFESLSESDTDRLGQQLAVCVPRGLVIALNGQLGSGKTRFVRALCTALSINPAHVSSPTFVLMQLYTDGRIPVAHFDTYRLADVDEFLAIGAEDFLNSGDYLCLIEWADRVVDVLPADRLQIDMEQTGITSRRFTLHAGGSITGTVLDALRSQLAQPSSDCAQSATFLSDSTDIQEPS